MDVHQQKEIKEFYTEFSEKVQDKIVSVEMVCFAADDTTFAELQLENISASKELWGLFVFCEHGLYFYVHPYESLMGMMIRQAAHTKAPVEQLLSITGLQDVHFIYSKKKWYEFFSSSYGKQMQMNFKGKDGHVHTVYIECQNKPSSVYEKILQLQQLLLTNNQNKA